ncbi:unnamed protein product, partial [Amoebophrya sp. A120]|eukprot:GSA120T00014043001.1
MTAKRRRRFTLPCPGGFIRFGASYRLQSTSPPKKEAPTTTLRALLDPTSAALGGKLDKQHAAACIGQVPREILRHAEATGAECDAAQTRPRLSDEVRSALQQELAREFPDWCRDFASQLWGRTFIPETKPAAPTPARAFLFEFPPHPPRPASEKQPQPAGARGVGSGVVLAGVVGPCLP